MEKPTQSLVYKGSILEAIDEAKKQKKLFVVYISGEDENSVLLEQSTWVDQNVHETISSYCVFLHLIEGSTDAKLFSAIYPQNSIPSISVINGHYGVMLWHHEGYISAENLKENIEKSCAQFQLQETAATLFATAALATNNPSQVGPTLSDTPSTSSHTQIQNSDNNKVSEENNNPICKKEAGPTGKEKSPKKDDVSISTSSAKSEQNNNPICKKEAGPTGKENSPKKDDVSISASSAKSESNKITKKDIKLKAPSSSKEIKEEKVKSVPISKVEKSNDVHINIRMPNGSSLQMKLTKSDALRSVKNFVNENQTVGFGSYDLAVPYPRKVFTEQDMDRTLSELDFANREALIVVPHQSSRAKSSFENNASINRDIPNKTNDESYFGYARKFISYFNPFSYLGGSNSESPRESTNVESPFLQHGGQSSVISRQGTGTGTATGTGTRPFGSNIHTLRSDNDEGDSSNDRNMFWNGNSTQFGGDDNNNNKK